MWIVPSGEQKRGVVIQSALDIQSFPLLFMFFHCFPTFICHTSKKGWKSPLCITLWLNHKKGNLLSWKRFAYIKYWIIYISDIAFKLLLSDIHNISCADYYFLNNIKYKHYRMIRCSTIQKPNHLLANIIKYRIPVISHKD